uniref:Uncharacterized protein LOC111128367 n=1 Tax=Crassostrea virginica TaxID=6565 RepID=A0A8B8DQ20_CRAVI|nr:uncharacterized protein LOC111128367 [Crassostrea virginica]
MDYLYAKLSWEKKAVEEANENIKRKHKHGTGICSVFILDTSESMAGEGLRQMKQAFHEILEEYTFLDKSDNVAVIGCGEDVKFLHYFSCNYLSIKNCVENIQCKGPSPLEAGVILSHSCLNLGGGHTVNMPPLQIRARAVVISDGNPTEITSSTESAETSPESETFKKLLSEIQGQGELTPFTFIPVGKRPNYRILGALALASKGGRLIGWQDARQYARLSLNFQVAGSLLRRYQDTTITEDLVRNAYQRYGRGSEEDINQVCEILNEKEAYDSVTEAESVFKERYPTMPCVGTRVRRGQDWIYENQDGYGPGTVVGHSQNAGWINVEWDNEKRYSYRYGREGIGEFYDVQICNEPRLIPENVNIAVGCLVRKGPDWKWGDQNGDEESIGTVYHVKNRNEVYVRWPNGNKSNYRFGYNDKYDVIVCDPRDSDIMERYFFQKKMEKDKNQTENNGGLPK